MFLVYKEIQCLHRKKYLLKFHSIKQYLLLIKQKQKKIQKDQKESE